LLGQPGLAVVGSRNVDEAGQESARLVGNACGREGLVLYSGGARGVDVISTHAALTARGAAVSILARSLERAVRAPDARESLIEGDLALITPYSPNAGFTVGLAMGRNKMIYALSDYALVVAADEGRGGTWAGATQALKAGWTPVFVLAGPEMPRGNRALIEQGANPFPRSLLTDGTVLREWLDAHVPPPSVVQPRLI
jgi:predicted Rossmann fold nucleotide-binding protein DprA/Smf involved in DNA uptake